MSMTIVSYNDVELNTDTVQAIFPLGSFSQGPSEPVMVERADSRPKYATKVLADHTFTIELKFSPDEYGDMETIILEMNGLFNTNDPVMKKLVVEDQDGKDWYLWATPIEVTDFRFTLVDVIMATDDPVWRSVDVNSELWEIDSYNYGEMLEIEVGGNMPVEPTFVFTPKVAGTEGFTYRRLATYVNPLDVPVLNYPLDITDGGFDTAALVTASKMQSLGEDLRVFVDGLEVNRWLADMDDTDTRVWITLDFQPGQSMKLRYDIDDEDDNEGLEVWIVKSTPGKKALKSLPASGAIRINNEIFTYTEIDRNKAKFKGVIRAARDTVAADHTAGDTIEWIEHEIWLMYGNSLIDAPVTDDTVKPVIDLDNSTNTSWIYTHFTTDDALRPASWSGRLVKTSNKNDTDNISGVYTAARDTDADPAEVMGLAMKSWKSGTAWKSENAAIEWNLYLPVGITHITADGEKYKSIAGWANARLQKSANDKTFGTVWTDATPSALNAWENLAAHSAVALGSNVRYLRFSLSGSIGGKADGKYLITYDNVTLTLYADGVPQGALAGEAGCYYLDVELNNLTTDETLLIASGMLLEQDLVVETEHLTAYLDDGSNVYDIETDTPRRMWLKLEPGTNELDYFAPGTNGIEIQILWEDRIAVAL